MSFYITPNFFILAAACIAIAAWRGLREKPLAPVALASSIVMICCLFLKTPEQFACFAFFIVVAGAAFVVLRNTPASKPLFYATLAATLLPLVVSKVSAAFESSLLAFAGISYLTFKAVQVIVEIHDGIIEKMSLPDWFAFIVFFPTFTQGPIDRSRRFLDDLHATPSKDAYAGMLARGILLIFAGLLYSMVIASFINRYYSADPWGNGPWYYELFKQIIISYEYGLYLFFDFAGCSLMAMGISYCLGIHTPRNFHAPFLAVDIKDFWNRWHITLSQWLRDFVFMRFSRYALKRKLFKNRLHVAQCGFMLNMVLMGAWHGLTPGYLLYGLYHGLLLAGNERFQKTKFYKQNKKKPLFKLCSWFICMQAVFFGFALFSGQIVNLICG